MTQEQRSCGFSTNRQLEFIQRVGRVGFWEYDAADRSMMLPETSRRLVCAIVDCPEDACPPFMDLLAGCDLAGGFEQVLDDALARREEFELVVNIPGGVAGDISLAIHGAPFEAAPGTYGLAGTFHDVTREKRGEEQLIRQRDEMKTIVDNFPGGISLFAADLRLTAYNHQFRDLLDFPDSLFEKGWAHFEELARFNVARGEYGPGDPDEQVRAIVERAHNFQAHRIERLRPNGRWLEIRGTPIPSGGFVTSYVDVTERKRIEGELVHAKEMAEARRAQVANLLDNSGQGFLSFGADLIVDEECSRACVGMLGAEPAGREAAEVLFAGQPGNADLLHATISAVFAETDPWLRATMLSLLPAEFPHGERLFRAEYKLLENGRVMVVLTDVTEERRLEAKVEAERQRLEMIVSAVTDSRDFFETVEAFREFIADGVRTILEAPVTLQAMVSEVYREVHTFKGLMNQFSFPHTPRVLHELEGRLDEMRHQTGVSCRALAELVLAVPFRALLDADLGVLRDALGFEFVENGDRIVLSANQAAQLQLLAERLLHGEPIDATTETMHRLLVQMEQLHKVSFAEALGGFDRVIRQTAARLEKLVAPIEVRERGQAWIDTRIYRPFLRSLTHVFRNAVVHGIEDPDTRLGLGKNEYGAIACTVAVEGASIVLVIEDDGAGIDVDGLRLRAVGAGLFGGEEVGGIADERMLELVFLDNFGTSTETTDLAGRGVGLAAVRSEARKLGGDVTVNTTHGVGTRFRFTLPLQADKIHRTEIPCQENN